LGIANHQTEKQRRAAPILDQPGEHQFLPVGLLETFAGMELDRCTKVLMCARVAILGIEKEWHRAISAAILIVVTLGNG
jgi:hypothetical protein